MSPLETLTWGSKAQLGKPLECRPPGHLHLAGQRHFSAPPPGFPPILCSPTPAQPAASLCLLGASDPFAWARASRSVHGHVGSAPVWARGTNGDLRPTNIWEGAVGEWRKREEGHKDNRSAVLWSPAWSPGPGS